MEADFFKFREKWKMLSFEKKKKAFIQVIIYQFIKFFTNGDTFGSKIFQ